MTDSGNTLRRRVTAGIVENIDLAPTHPGHFRMIIDSPRLAKCARPGQFVHVLPAAGIDMLRRPFSFHSLDKMNGHISILYRVIGEGTRLLSCVEPGGALDAIGPLGNGFPIDRDHPAILVGGGVGIPPLVFLASELKQPLVFIGARDIPALVCIEDFSSMNIIPVIATEDGSAGFKGLVTEAMDDYSDFREQSVVHACGPIPMLAAVARWSEKRGFKCIVSLENKLGCGIGACLGCSIPVREKDGSIHYERVCVDGPVFDASRVAFDMIRRD